MNSLLIPLLLPGIIPELLPIEPSLLMKALSSLLAED
jgi:hypothetical protein